jgi:hypothetical protein
VLNIGRFLKNDCWVNEWLSGEKTEWTLASDVPVSRNEVLGGNKGWML